MFISKRSFLLGLAAAFAAAVVPGTAGAADRKSRKRRRKKRGPRPPKTLPSLYGAGDALARENAAADRDGLERIADRTRLRQLIAAGTLAPVRDTDAWAIDPELGENDPEHAALYRHALPHVRDFMTSVLGEGHRVTGVRYLVTSLVRTEEYQARLIRVNPNAARGSVPWRRSSHLTGATLDFRTTNMGRKARDWMRRRLVAWEAAGYGQATEEVRNGCWHVMVYKNRLNASP